jgi:hypothetical protein
VEGFAKRDPQLLEGRLLSRGHHLGVRAKELGRSQHFHQGKVSTMSQCIHLIKIITVFIMESSQQVSSFSFRKSSQEINIFIREKSSQQISKLIRGKFLTNSQFSSR